MSLASLPQAVVKHLHFWCEKINCHWGAKAQVEISDSSPCENRKAGTPCEEQGCPETARPHRRSNQVANH